MRAPGVVDVRLVRELACHMAAVAEHAPGPSRAQKLRWEPDDTLAHAGGSGRRGTASHV